MSELLPPPPPDLLDGAALFLDFDGTLVELAETPDAISVPDHLHSLLDRLGRALSGSLAIISGRAISDLERHLGPLPIAVSGSHGLELRTAEGQMGPVPAPATLAVARDEIRQFAADAPGVIVEDKPASVALHYRGAPDREADAVALAGGLAARTGLTVQAGKMVVELRPAGADKGDALRRLMAEPAFANKRPVFVGDDLTDEHAFVAAKEMGGAGILVGPSRETAAAWRLDDVAAVAAWLMAVTGGVRG
ncbi:trehalose-phosphatase [Allosphingosinicella deserti]|uniref:Trehalose 6-phosphate phosphatase n=1 Tax=Allosphingosinicella deserti TaxID=2116704 RepID=A0A2P7QNQ2_9SPHN|nr:trehalose-phosphatase [Sphingomonas deserti]PSJ39578.1 trehalose-phosphatase [Sphingomonas deserti]